MFLTNKHGKQLEVTLSLSEAIEIVSKQESSFAKSLVASAQRDALRGDQTWWLYKLAQTCDVVTWREKGKEGKEGYEKITELFQQALENLKYPKVSLGILQFVWSPKTGKIFLRDRGRRLGFITNDGKLTLQEELTKEQNKALELFAENPREYGKAYGIKTGSCCYCARELTDARSVLQGYGPICASKWGLPWGERPEVSFIDQARELKRKIALAERYL